MKTNGVQSEYVPVSQGVQSDDDENHQKSNSLEEGKRLKNGSIDEKKATNGSSLEAGGGGGEGKDEKKEPMSPLRKFCFVLSILQCVLFIVAFGYLIPCKIPRFVETHPGPWQYILKHTDSITTDLSYAKTSKTEGFIVFGSTSVSNETSHHLTALYTLDGTVAWSTALLSSPTSVYCQDYLKTSVKGTPSCLSTSEEGRLGSFNLQTGHWNWYMHDHTSKQELAPSKLSVPVIGEDCFSDSVPEIVVAGFEAPNTFNIYVVNGSTGQLKSTVNLTHCSAMPEHLTTWKQKGLTNILYMCKDRNGFDNVWSIPMEELCRNESHSLIESLSIHQIHSGEKEDPIVDVHHFKNVDQNDHVLIISKKGEIEKVTLYGKDPWKLSLPANTLFRDITGGSFVNISTETSAILYANLDKTSNIIILDLMDGSILNNITYSNSADASFLYTAVNDLNEPDTLIIRNIPNNQQHPQEESSSSNSTGKLLEEFVVVECKTNNTFKSVWQLEDSIPCDDENKCSPGLIGRSSVVFGDFSGSGKSSAVHAFNSVDSETKLSITKLQMEHVFYYIPEKECKTCNC